MKKLIQEEFIHRATIKHNSKYLYDKVEYVLSTSKVLIICRIHGEFEQEANAHLRGIGCPKCSGNIKSNTISFIEKSKSIHGDKYDYSKVDYIGSLSKVIIICPKHGEFLQKPNSHLNRCGCNICGIERTKKKTSKGIEEFIKKSNLIHNYKYNYSDVKYTNNRSKVKIVCPDHGMFEQTPYVHINGGGCLKCGYKVVSEKNSKTLDDFISRATEIHKNKYDYSLVEYKGTDIKVKIICKEHGVFEQKCSKHLQNQGCPTCSESKLEKETRLFLIENNIEFKQQYGSKDDKFYLRGQRLDFYLPKYNIAIECQGDQHFRPVDFGNKGEEYALNSFKKNILRDFKKYSECVKNDVEIIYYCSRYNFDNEYIGEIYSELCELIKKIK